MEVLTFNKTSQGLFSPHHFPHIQNNSSFSRDSQMSSQNRIVSSKMKLILLSPKRNTQKLKQQSKQSKYQPKGQMLLDIPRESTNAIQNNRLSQNIKHKTSLKSYRVINSSFIMKNFDFSSDMHPTIVKELKYGDYSIRMCDEESKNLESAFLKSLFQAPRHHQSRPSSQSMNSTINSVEHEQKSRSRPKSQYLSFRGESIRSLQLRGSLPNQRNREQPPEEIITNLLQKTISRKNQINKSREILHGKFRGKMAATLANPSPYLQQEQHLDGLTKFLSNNAIPKLNLSPTSNLLADALPTVRRLSSLKDPLPNSSDQANSPESQNFCKAIDQSFSNKTSSCSSVKEIKHKFSTFCTSKSRALQLQSLKQTSSSLKRLNTFMSTRNSLASSQTQAIGRIKSNPFLSKDRNSQINRTGQKVQPHKSVPIKSQIGYFPQIKKNSTNLGKIKEDSKKKTIKWFKACINSESKLDLFLKTQRKTQLIQNLQKEISRQSQFKNSLKTSRNSDVCKLIGTKRHGSLESLSIQGSSDIDSGKPVNTRPKIPFIRRVQMGQF